MIKKKEIVVNLFLSVIILAIIASCSSEKKKETLQEHPDKHSSMLMISENDRLLAGIRSDTAVVKNIAETTTLVGKTAVDERKIEVVTARVKGRLDELYIKNSGEYIKQGQAVYAIYSEELLADENDYLLAIEQYNNAISQKEIARQLLEASRKKLLLWTLTDAQIKELERSKKASSLIKFYSPFSGYLIELPIRQGEYVEIGSPLLKIADLNSLWIEIQIYSDEVQYLNQNPSLQIEFESFPDEIFKGEIVFNNPTIEENEKINLVRVRIDNKEKKLKPGMMAYISLKRNEKKALVIPKSALLLESTASVWVEDKDGMFEQRMVTTGIENKKEVEILSGIQPGERVVVSGAFFLMSESVVRQGSGSMGGMKM